MAKQRSNERHEQLMDENRLLRERLAEAEETLAAIRSGEVDAIVVSGQDGEQVYSLTSAETPYRVIIEEMNDGAVTLSAEGVILYSNRRFAELVNEPVERIIGSSFRRFIEVEEHAAFAALILQGRMGRSSGIAVSSLRKGGEPLYLQLSLSPLPEEMPGEICLMAADITELKRKERELIEIHSSLERRVAERTAELAQTVDELRASRFALQRTMDEALDATRRLELANKQLTEDGAVRMKMQTELLVLYEQTQQDAVAKAELLNEVNHRVKNNLMMILGLILAEKRRAAADRRDDITVMWQQFENRIGGLLQVHQILSDSKWRPVNIINLAERVCRGLMNSGGQGGPAVKFVFEPSTVELSPRLAAGFALVFNELFTNSLKYAFRTTERPVIRLNVVRNGESVAVEYGDNGTGYPPDVLAGKNYHVGLNLINQFIEGMLDGELALKNHEGAAASISFVLE